MLANQQAFRSVAWHTPDLSTGKGRLKSKKKVLARAGIVSLKTAKRSAADLLRCASSAMRAGLNHGLEVFVPSTRLRPGHSVILDPPAIADRPLVKFVLDEAGNGVLGKNYLWSICGVRGFHDIGKCHRKDNNFMVALKHTGSLFNSLLKLIMLANVNRGPWLGGMFLEKKAEALDMYLKATLLDPQEVSKHMEGIAFDLGQDVANDIDVGQVHQAIAGLLDCRTFFNKSMSMEMKRWFSLTYVWPFLNKEWTANKMVLEWMHVQMAEWEPEDLQELDRLKDVAAIPGPDPEAMPGSGLDPIADGHSDLQAVVAEGQPAASVNGSAAAADPDEEQQRRLQTLASLRKKSKNTLHLAGLVANDRAVQVHGRIMYAFAVLGRASVAEDLKQHRGQLDTARWYSCRVVDEGYALCLAMAQVLDSRVLLEQAQMSSRVHLPGHDRALFHEELELAELTFKLAWEYMSLTAWSDHVHGHCLPYTFAVAAHVDLDIARTGLQACGEDWDAILDIEGIVFQDLQRPATGFLKRLLDDLDFHQHQLVREGCHLFSQGLPPKHGPWDPELPDGERLVFDMFAGPANTKFWQEDMFRDVSQLLKSKANNASRFTRMACVVEAAASRANCPDIDAAGGHVSNAMRQVAGTLVSDQAIPSKKTMSSGCFAVPTDRAKAMQTQEIGQTFDLGQPVQDLKPLIDLSDLYEQEQSAHKKKQQQGAAAQAVSISAIASVNKPTCKPASQEANHRSIAAMALVRALRDIPASEDKELAAFHSWWATLLHKGLFFRHRRPGQAPLTFLSLGFHGHAALCWALAPIVGRDGAEYLCLSRVALQAGRCQQQHAFCWMYGH